MRSLNSVCNSGFQALIPTDSFDCYRLILWHYIPVRMGFRIMKRRWRNIYVGVGWGIHFLSLFPNGLTFLFKYICFIFYVNFMCIQIGSRKIKFLSSAFMKEPEWTHLQHSSLPFKSVEWQTVPNEQLKELGSILWFNSF